MNSKNPFRFLLLNLPDGVWPSPAATIALGLALTASLPALGAEEVIVTDRPDFVESSNTVGAGRFQVETSVNVERNRLAGTTEHTLTTPTLLRYGIAEAWELRVESDGYTHLSTSGSGTLPKTRERGYSDLSLGAKWHMRDGDSQTGAPSLGWLFHLDIPSGSSEFEGPGTVPSVRMVAEWELYNDFSLGVMPGLMWDINDDDQRFAAGILGVVVGRSWTDNFRTFVEWSGQRLASSSNGGSVITYDVGAAYLLSNHVQLDTALSFGANEYSPDLSWTVGLSVKY